MKILKVKNKITGSWEGVSAICGTANGAADFDYTVYGLPIVYLNGDTTGMSKDNSVTLDYVYGDRSGTASVKWQGTSSLNYPKKNYTIKFDTAFEAVSGWGEQRKYCLKAYYIDYSQLRDRVGAKIWAAVIGRRTDKDTYLSTAPNRGAVAGFPCMVVINGEYMGLYSFNIPKDPWMFGFAEDDVNCAVVGMAKAGDITHFKAATVIDDSNTAFEYEHLADGADEATMTAQFSRIYTALQSVTDNSTLYENVQNVCLDLLSVIQHFIFSVVLSHRDGIGKNTLFFTNDGGNMWHVSEYDMDGTFGNNADGGASYYSGKDQTFQYYADKSKLFEVIYNYDASRLITQYKNLRKTALLEAFIINTILNEGAKIPKPVLDYEAQLWPGIPGTNTNNANQMIAHVLEHLAQCDAEIAVLEASLASES